MQATVEQLAQIQVFTQLQPSELQGLRAHSRVQEYKTGEMVMHQSDRIPAKLFALLDGVLRITKTASTGKETILRTLSPGEIFAAPALLGNGIAPATVTAERNCLVITVVKDALLKAIRNNPEIALRMLMVFNQRLQQLHDTVHGLVSERAIVCLARLIQYFAEQYGTEKTPDGICLKANLSYYKIARSIGITYEECVRLIKSMKSVLVYRRGGKIAILDAEALAALALACASAHMPSGNANP
ncbi:MAG TPA: cyclic nucleotide-binding protein [Cyanobacteria bacterium UBA11372]|nr:cyclic nucleotide-binding protein [Cyanobacteria bacterium UBA11372]